MLPRLADIAKAVMSEIDVGRSEVVEALVVETMIVMLDQGCDLLF